MLVLGGGRACAGVSGSKIKKSEHIYFMDGPLSS